MPSPSLPAIHLLLRFGSRFFGTVAMHDHEILSEHYFKPLLQLKYLTMTWSSPIAILAAIATHYGGDAFVTNTHRPVIQTTTLYASPSIGIFFGTSTGSTEEAAHLISAELGDVASEPIEIDEVQGSVAAQFAKFDSLVVGTPTWNTGDNF